MNKEEVLNVFLLAKIPEIITQEEFDDVQSAIKELLKENQELKKQLEEKENQQEEFIESLVNEIKEHEKYDKKNNCEWQGYNFYQDVLLKHKEIIGDKE